MWCTLEEIKTNWAPLMVFVGIQLHLTLQKTPFPVPIKSNRIFDLLSIRPHLVRQNWLPNFGVYLWFSEVMGQSGYTTLSILQIHPPTFMKVGWWNADWRACLDALRSGWWTTCESITRRLIRPKPWIGFRHGTQFALEVQIGLFGRKSISNDYLISLSPSTWNGENFIFRVHSPHCAYSYQAVEKPEQFLRQLR